MIQHRMIKFISVLLLLHVASGRADTHPLSESLLASMARSEEQRLNARIGITVMDTSTSVVASYRGSERFPMNSTHKALLCGALLLSVDQGKFALTDRTQFDRSQWVTYSPVTEKHVAPQSMSWEQLCSAAISYSDNTAANLIAKKLGGPAEVTRIIKSTGDDVTRFDRYEPELNSAVPGDERDSTTPIAISQTLHRLLFGPVLQASSRELLSQWMRDDKVADALLRSVLPPQWKIADKTGAGDYGSRSILSVVWPEKRPPVIIAIYITQTSATLTQSNEAIARIGKALFSAMRDNKS